MGPPELIGVIEHMAYLGAHLIHELLTISIIAVVGVWHTDDLYAGVLS